ncbi:biotin/lipoyl-binding protein [Nocardioides sp. GY 10113]|uniref:efflux RND transporter periplasmic adaptor subunit n=1 Tax=Nocardioides sp. GY 10113 TaxID=2569761 RepID=UPI001F0DCDB8|nr:biotin/lipoyl-binding protein [Nocardioides sp. GY 10113]
MAVLVLAVALAATSGAWLLLRDGTAAATTTATATVTLETVTETVSASGTVAAADTDDLDFEVGGIVTAVYVEPGDRVRKGDRLAAIDDAALVAARTAAVSSLTAAQAQLEEDQAADASDTQVAADRAAVVAARSALAQARADVADAVLCATMRGTVAAVEVGVGDSVGSSGGSSMGSSSSSGASGTGAVSLVSVGRYVVDATVGAAEVERVRTGLQARITVTGVDDVVYGTVAEVGAIAETSSSGAAVFPVTIEVTGTRDDLYAGTSADATITVKQTPDVLTVATRAVQSDDQGTYVDLLVDGEPVRTPIEVGQALGMTTEVVSGVSEGDVVQVPGFAGPGGGTGGGRRGTGEGGQRGGFPGGGTPPDPGGDLPAGVEFPGGGQ